MRKAIFLLLLFSFVSYSLAQEETISRPADATNFLDGFVGASLQINETQGLDAILNVILPLSFSVEFSDAQLTYTLSITKTKILSVQNQSIDNVDLKAVLPESLVNELLAKESLNQSDILSFLSDDALTLYPYSWKTDLALTNIEELLNVKFNIVIEKSSTKVLHTFSVVVSKLVGLLNSIFGFIKF